MRKEDLENVLHSGHIEIKCDTENHRVTYITGLCNRKVEQGGILKRLLKLLKLWRDIISPFLIGDYTKKFINTVLVVNFN